MSPPLVRVQVRGSSALMERVARALAGKPFAVGLGSQETSSSDLMVVDADSLAENDATRHCLVLSSSWGAREEIAAASKTMDVMRPDASDAELVARIQRLARGLQSDETRGVEEFLANLPEGALHLRRDGAIVSLNQAGHAILGWPEVRPGARWDTLLTLSDDTAATELIASAARGDRVRHADAEVLLLSGQRVTLAISFGSLPKSGDLLVSFRDVTAERQTEAALRRNSDFLHHLIDSSSDAIIASDLRGRLLVYNRAAEKLFGIPSEEALEKVNVSELYPQGGAREVMRLLRDSLTGHIETVRTYGKFVSGDLIPVELSASLLKMKGKEIASVGLLRDIRERVRVEAELARTRTRLIEAEKQRDITALAGATAHELNQPLTVIVGRTELLLRKLEGPQRAHVQAIAEQAERMAEIVKRVAKLTHIRTLAYPGELEIADLESPDADAAGRSRAG